MQPIPRITFEQLAARYPVLLLDAYGVLVHSTGVLPDAAARIAYLNRTGKTYFLLTNDASRLPAAADRSCASRAWASPTAPSSKKPPVAAAHPTW